MCSSAWAPQQEGGIGEGHGNPIACEGAWADSAGNNMFLRAPLFCPPSSVWGGKGRHQVSADGDPITRSRSRSGHSAVHGNWKKVMPQPVTTLVGEEFIYKYNGLVIASRFGCQCSVTASCHGEDFIQQNSQWHSFRHYFRHLCCYRKQQVKLSMQSKGNSAFASCSSAPADPVHLRASRWGGPCCRCAGGPTARFLSSGRETSRGKQG